MLKNKYNHELFLLSYAALKSKSLSLSKLEFDAINIVADWAKKFLCSPHSDLGRSGVVCPFVKSAIDFHDSIFFSSLVPPTLSIKTIEPVLLAYRQWFEELEPLSKKKRNFKAIVIVLPSIPTDNSGVELIEQIHTKLKPSFVHSSLMLGQFYPTCNASGLHNANFRPLRSPIPLFVIRHMQITDLAFLVNNEDFIRSYCKTFNINSATELKKLVCHIPKLPDNWNYFVTKAFEELPAIAS